MEISGKFQLLNKKSLLFARRRRQQQKNETEEKSSADSFIQCSTIAIETFPETFFPASAEHH